MSTTKETFQGYITKYALTEARVREEPLATTTSPSMVNAVNRGQHALFHVEGKDWHRTRESAVKRAEEMRAKKIASLKKQIAKLEKLKFDQPPA